MKIKEDYLKKIRSYNIPELRVMEGEKKIELSQLKRDLKFGKLKNCKKVENIKKEIAKILTVISEKAEVQTRMKITTKQ